METLNAWLLQFGDISFLTYGLLVSILLVRRLYLNTRYYMAVRQVKRVRALHASGQSAQVAIDKAIARMSERAEAEEPPLILKYLANDPRLFEDSGHHRNVA